MFGNNDVLKSPYEEKEVGKEERRKNERKREEGKQRKRQNKVLFLYLANL